MKTAVPTNIITMVLLGWEGLQSICCGSSIHWPEKSTWEWQAALKRGLCCVGVQFWHDRGLSSGELSLSWSDNDAFLPLRWILHCQRWAVLSMLCDQIHPSEMNMCVQLTNAKLAKVPGGHPWWCCWALFLSVWLFGPMELHQWKIKVRNKKLSSEMRVSCEIHLSSVQVQHGDKDLWWDILTSELMGATSALKNLKRKHFSPVWQMLR